MQPSKYLKNFDKIVQLFQYETDSQIELGYISPTTPGGLEIQINQPVKIRTQLKKIRVQSRYNNIGDFYQDPKGFLEDICATEMNIILLKEFVNHIRKYADNSSLVITSKWKRLKYMFFVMTKLGRKLWPKFEDSLAMQLGFPYKTDKFLTRTIGVLDLTANFSKNKFILCSANVANCLTPMPQFKRADKVGPLDELSVHGEIVSPTSNHPWTVVVMTNFAFVSDTVFFGDSNGTFLVSSRLTEEIISDTLALQSYVSLGAPDPSEQYFSVRVKS